MLRVRWLVVVLFLAACDFAFLRRFALPCLALAFALVGCWRFFGELVLLEPFGAADLLLVRAIVCYSTLNRLGQ